MATQTGHPMRSGACNLRPEPTSSNPTWHYPQLGSSNREFREHEDERRLQEMERENRGFLLGTAVGGEGPSPPARGAHHAEWQPGARPGPSPHARGAERLRAVPRPGHGTIPARAGSRTGWLRRRRRSRDHSRARGEHCRSMGPVALGAGPSPRARGASNGEPSVKTDGTGPSPRAGSIALYGAVRRCEGPSPRARGA